MFILSRKTHWILGNVLCTLRPVMKRFLTASSSTSTAATAWVTGAQAEAQSVLARSFWELFGHCFKQCVRAASVWEGSSSSHKVTSFWRAGAAGVVYCRVDYIVVAVQVAKWWPDLFFNMPRLFWPLWHFRNVYWGTQPTVPPKIGAECVYLPPVFTAHHPFSRTSLTRLLEKPNRSLCFHPYFPTIYPRHWIQSDPFKVCQIVSCFLWAQTPAVSLHFTQRKSPEALQWLMKPCFLLISPLLSCLPWARPARCLAGCGRVGELPGGPLLLLPPDLRLTPVLPSFRLRSALPFSMEPALSTLFGSVTCPLSL